VYASPKEEEMNGRVARMGEMWNIHEVLVRKSEQTTRRPKHDGKIIGYNGC
jgi:hypothetical protein